MVNHHRHHRDSRPQKVKATLDVLDRVANAVVTIPMADVHFAPTGPSGMKARPVLCEHYNAQNPIASCRRHATKDCTGVHADLRRAKSELIHVNYAYHRPDDCPFPRMPAGHTVYVKEPLSAKTNYVDEVPSECVLQTKCLLGDPARPGYRCAHFYYGRECHLGSRCDFAHIVHVAPGPVVQGEKAPAPSTFGRGRDSPLEVAVQYAQQQMQLVRGSHGALGLAPLSDETLARNQSASHSDDEHLGGRDDTSSDGEFHARADAPRTPEGHFVATLPWHTPQNTTPLSAVATRPPPPADNLAFNPATCGTLDAMYAAQPHVFMPTACAACAPQPIVSLGAGRWRHNPYAV